MKNIRLVGFVLWASLSLCSWAETRVRFISANLTSGNRQSYDAGHGKRVMKALCDATDADAPHAVVIGVQEFNFGDNSDAAVGAFVREVCGPDAVFYREQSSSPIPNGFIVRGLEILDAGHWVDKVTSNRGFAWAKIGLPHGQYFYAYSVHFSTRSTGNRLRQATKLNELTDQHVPLGNARILMGDLNTSSSTEAAWTELKTHYVDSAVPVDTRGNSGTNAARKKRYDVVIANDVLTQWRVPVDLRRSQSEPVEEGINTFPKGFVFDPAEYPDVAKRLPPARKTDSQSANYQHHAVVQDYLIPEEGAFDCVREVKESTLPAQSVRRRRRK